MRLSKRFILIVPLIAVSLPALSGCGSGEQANASTPEELQDAQKLRAASLKGEGDGVAPKVRRFRR